ncbi:MAG: response regulator transcription factor [Tannerellaceae bacterium]|jgi:DNA-binding response OmpR family regulator|nr:response regulator transcription factor [Tannerellaceae bacterium]
MTKKQIEILFFEQDKNIGTVVREFMQMSGFRITLCESCEEAYKAYENNPFPVCIVSFEQNSCNEGFELARTIKAGNQDVVLIFMSTNPTMQTMSEAYTLGADDFMRKPFALEELQMRIRVIMRRMEHLKSMSVQSYQIGKFHLNATKQTLSIEGKTTKVTTKECDLLMYLCENMNNLVSREDILRNVWRNDSYYNARSMDVYITKLRDKLREDKLVGIINVHGKGYKLVVLDEDD